MTGAERDLIKLYEETDNSGKELIFDAVLCATVCGEPFFKGMQELLEQGDKARITEALKRWIDVAKAISPA